MTSSLAKRLALGLLLLGAIDAAAAQRPNLIVVISIDQFRYEYLTRFEPYFSPDGFRRFIDHGADFTNARYPYLTTYTGPGHAAIGSGHVPAESGIVANTWFDRRKGAPEYCVADDRVAGGFSPLNLQSDSLGDRLQEHEIGARVFAASLKDRAAILMGGRKATAAYWFDSSLGGFTSSSYYHWNRALATQYNQTIPGYLAQHPAWTQSTFIPAADLSKVTYDPESLRKHKLQVEGLGLSFPHPIRSLDALTFTPFGNGLLLGFVERLIETEHVGGGPVPDLLFIGLSSQDYLGHTFGPDSLEVADSVVRIDRDIAAFLEWLDERMKGTYTAVITADHGVQSIPEVARAMGREAGRVGMGNPGAKIRTFGELDARAPQRVAMEKAVAAAFGRKITDDTPVTDGLILSFEEPAIYLNWARIAELKLDGERVKRAFRAAALNIKGVSGAFTNSELLTTEPPRNALEAAVRLSFRADRSGDVLITLRPGYIWGHGSTGTTHGQPVDLDQHVPVMFWGDDVFAGHYDSAASPTDIASTLAAIFGFDAGGMHSIILPAVASPRDVLSAVMKDAPKFEHLLRGAKLPAGVDAGIAFAPPQPSLPAGYARLDRLEIDGDTAYVTLWYGPIPPPRPGKITLACGSGHMFTLKRDADGAWKIVSRGVAAC